MKIIILICLALLLFACQTFKQSTNAVAEGAITGAAFGIAGPEHVEEE